MCHELAACCSAVYGCVRNGQRVMLQAGGGNSSCCLAPVLVVLPRRPRACVKGPLDVTCASVEQNKHAKSLLHSRIFTLKTHVIGLESFARVRVRQTLWKRRDVKTWFLRQGCVHIADL